MRKRYRLFLRGNVFWCQDNETRKQESLRTRDRSTAERVLHARNEAHLQPVINLQIARAYLMVSDPAAARRTWQVVMDEVVKLKRGETQIRWAVAIKDHALDGVRGVPLLSARAATSSRRGMRTTRSSGPHPEPGGSWPCAASVMSAPITAKSPQSISRMSGQL